MMAGNGTPAGVTRFGITGSIFTAVGFATVIVGKGVLVGPGITAMVGSTVSNTTPIVGRLSTGATSAVGITAVGIKPAGRSQANILIARMRSAIIHRFLAI
jgi:hypothetical protein